MKIICRCCLAWLIAFVFTLILCVLLKGCKSNIPKATVVDEKIQTETKITACVKKNIPKFTSEIIEKDNVSEKPYIDAFEIMWDLPIRAEVQICISEMCASRDVDAPIIIAMIYHESRYDEKAVGDNGKAFGLMQIQPRWHEERIQRLGITDLLDGSQNVIVGIDYLDELLEIYGGNYSKALTAYNQGHYNGTVSAYATKILNEAQTLIKKYM